MEVSEVRRRVVDAIERSKRAAAERRSLADEASRDYGRFLDEIAVPLFKQVANALKAHGYPFGVATPGGSVRLMSENRPDDYIEVVLDTTGEQPLVIGHSHRSRGRRILESERPIAAGPVRDIREDQLLGFLLKELEPYLG